MIKGSKCESDGAKLFLTLQDDTLQRTNKALDSSSLLNMLFPLFLRKITGCLEFIISPSWRYFGVGALCMSKKNTNYKSYLWVCLLKVQYASYSPCKFELTKCKDTALLMSKMSVHTEIHNAGTPPTIIPPLTGSPCASDSDPFYLSDPDSILKQTESLSTFETCLVYHITVVILSLAFYLVSFSFLFLIMSHS